MRTFALMACAGIAAAVQNLDQVLNLAETDVSLKTEVDDSLEATIDASLEAEVDDSLEAMIDVSLEVESTTDTTADMRYAANCCQVWDKFDYKGATKRYCLEEWQDGHQAWDLTLEFNNRISSWKCGEGVAMKLCRAGISHDCPMTDASGGAGLSENPRHGYNDAASSLHLYSYNKYTGPGAAVLYEDANCRGFSMYLMAGDPG